MNRLSTVVPLFLLVSIAFSAPNEWDSTNSFYSGAFGTTNGFSPDWSTATNIYTRVPENPGNLGYLTIRNQASTMVTISNSFNGFIDSVFDGSAVITNTYDLHEGIVVTGADATIPTNASPRDAFSISGGSQETVFIKGKGTYRGGAGSDGAEIKDLAALYVTDTVLEGGNGLTLTSGVDVVVSGGNGLAIEDVENVYISGQQTIRGGNGGHATITNSSETSTADGGYGISFSADFADPSITPRINIDGTSVIGGDGGTTDGFATNFSAKGGAALYISGSAFAATNASFSGGDGGDIQSITTDQFTSRADASGGCGIEIVGSSSTTVVDSAHCVDTDVIGGSGGSVTNINNSGNATAFANGGTGVEVSEGFNSLTISGTNSSYRGGGGGIAVSSGSAEANGGDGISFSADIADPNTTPRINIDGTSVIGGDGGMADSLREDSSAKGGTALYISRGAFAATNASFSGGDGGDIQSITTDVFTSRADVSGGYGIEIVGSSSTGIVDTAHCVDTRVIGGSGGSVTNINSSVNATAVANGGTGVEVSEGFNSLTISGTGTNSTYRGGGGGIAVSSGRAEANGGDGISFSADIADPNTTPRINIDGTSVIGGDGGMADSLNQNSSAKGGTALYISGGALAATNASFSGGDGGDIETIVDSLREQRADVSGGYGIEIVGSSSNGIVDSAHCVDTRVIGGSGGSVININMNINFPEYATAFANGGTGVEISEEFNSFTVSGTNSSYRGGGGGIAISSGSAEANGGDGIRILGSSSRPTVLVVSNGVFSGGAGGIALNTSGGSATANGGDGIYAENADVSIYGGEFHGGLAGSSNIFSGGIMYSAVGENGIALHIQDSKLAIANGKFGIGEFGLKALSTEDNTNTVVISGGEFGLVEFGGAGNNIIDISGGIFTSNLLFSGDADSMVDFSADSMNGGIYQTGGRVTFTNWIDALFEDTTVSNGTMVFENQHFNLLDGAVFRLQSRTAKAIFNDDLTITNGATLDVGLGEVTTSNFVAKTGSHLRTQFADDEATIVYGGITGDNLTFETNLHWTIYGVASNALPSTFHLASATNGISHELKYTDFETIGDPYEWLMGIYDVTTNMVGGIYNLDAYYGVMRFSDVFEIEEGEEEFAKVIDDLDRLLPVGSDEHEAFRRLLQVTEEEGRKIMVEGYTRTPEVASALISMQSIFAGQVKGRTRSYLRRQGWGSNTAAPRGASGPEDWYDDSVQWLRDHLPSWDMSGTSRSLDERLPKVESKREDKPPVRKPYIDASSGIHSEYDAFIGELNEKLPESSGEKIEVPTTYQVWGRGYGSYLDQDNTDGHEGYRAQIGGAVVGFDKRFNNLLAGLGCGYAHTAVNGNSKNNAAVDTGHGVAYLAVNGEHLYFDANVSYAFNDVETEGNAVLGYTGEYDAQTVSTYLGGGLGFTAFKDTLLFSPEASFLATYFSRDSYSETSPYIAVVKEWDAYDQWSYLASVGATISMIRQIESFNTEMRFQPEIRVHWLHEFNNEMDNDSYIMAGGLNNISVELQAREEDLVKIGGGVRFSKWDSDKLELGLDVDGVIGQDYSAYLIGAKLMHSF